jgi:lipopolysaccharide transport protein LptA
MKKTLIFGLLMVIIPLCNAAPLSESAFKTISISADEAIEDELPGILHFKGRFLMQSNDWNVMASQATVYGELDKPDRIYLEGEPARFLVVSTTKTAQGSIDASALVVEYLHEANKLILSGQATLMLGDEVIRSTYIEYDISTNRYVAGGDDGVLIKVPPVD